MKKSDNPYENALIQVDDAAKIIKKDYLNTVQFERLINKIKKPDRVIQKNIILKSGKEKKIFRAFRSQHNDCRGPYKGGIRFHSNVTRNEVMALSLWMSIKCAVVGIPYGGGKGGVVVDPKKLTQDDVEKLCRLYARAYAKHIGPQKDVPAPDVNTGEREMAFMLDEYERVIGQHSPATFTGKPIEMGGSFGRTEATGLGGYFILKNYAKTKKLIPAKTSIAVQGFGNVGYWFSHFAHKNSFKVVAVSDSSGGVYSKNGLNIEILYQLKNQGMAFKEIGEKYPKKYETISNEDLLTIKVDILVPSALENAINFKNVKNVKAEAILELANGPTTSDADKYLSIKNIEVVPDVLANAGGVTVSYFEWVQNLGGYRWDKEKVFRELEKIMDDAFKQIHSLKISKKVSYRQAAYSLALRKIVDAMVLRGK